jgi:putative resolvase
MNDGKSGPTEDQPYISCKEVRRHYRVGTATLRASQKQTEDLARQRQSLVSQYPDYEVVEDIASGVNFHRRGLVTLLERAVRGGVEEVVVAHRDRLCRVAFDLVKSVIKACRCKVVVLGQSMGYEDGETAELQEDLLPLVGYFVASNKGERAAQNGRRRAQEAAEREGCNKEEGDAMDEEGPDTGTEGERGNPAL